MLDLNPDTVCLFIDKAKEFHAKEGIVIPEVPNDPSDDWARQILADHVDDLTFQEFKANLDDLEQEQQATVVALMWLGRGDYTEDEWDEALEEAISRWTPHTAEYLMSTPLVADYLEEGLNLLGYECNE